MEQQNPVLEQKTFEKILLENLREQRARRRWGVFFKIAWLIFFILLLIAVWPDNNLGTSSGKKHVSLVDIRGEIDDSSSADADDIISGLNKAFKDKDTQAVILRINSPGGSPVQAQTVYSQIRYLRQKYPDIKIYAVCSDLCTSAAYYIASATDDIYASPVSLVGSIGVLMDGFGFVDGMHKIGVDRRLITAGAHKGFLDPFSPLKPDELQFAQTMLEDVHQSFIKDVEQGRGSRLKTNDPNIFSGLVWTGQQALPLGLIDGLGSAQSVARDVIKNKTIVDYTVKPGYLDQLANRFGSSFAHELGSEFKDKLT